MALNQSVHRNDRTQFATTLNSLVRQSRLHAQTILKIGEIKYNNNKSICIFRTQNENQNLIIIILLMSAVIISLRLRILNCSSWANTSKIRFELCLVFSLHKVRRSNVQTFTLWLGIVIYLLYWWFFQIIRFGQYRIGWINVFIERYGFGEDLFDAIFIIN